jgi:tetraacyldisaccharide 4'-kinase
MNRLWRWALLPLNPLYRGAVALRAAAYDRQWLRQRRLDVPVISVGNLTFGGTGKTPMVIALVRDLVHRGRRPAVLTRGYRRSADHQLVLLGPEPRQAVAEAGDEPIEMARRLPGVPVVVDADRGRGGAEAQRLGADVLVLDDGFQHLQLARDLDLVLLDAGDPWGGGRLPPLGRLREPVSAIARADAVVVTKVPVDHDPTVVAITEQVRELQPEMPVFAARTRITRVRQPERGWVEPEVLAGAKVVVFAGLARPQGFADLLEAADTEVVAQRWFPDHHVYTADDLAELADHAERAGAGLVTTAKDFVKLENDAPVWVVEVEMVPAEDTWDELWRLIPEVKA